MKRIRSENYLAKTDSYKTYLKGMNPVGVATFPIQNIANFTKDLLSAVFGCITAPKLVSLCYIAFITDQFCVATKKY